MIPSKALNSEFNFLTNKINKISNWKEFLSKVAIYSYNIKKYNSMQQGKHVEDCMIEILNARPFNHDSQEIFTYYGNCDFYLNKMPISLKSSIRKTDILTLDGVPYNNHIKIFDTSRNRNCPKYWKTHLNQMLSKIGWEIPLLFYMYDITKNKGLLFFTSLTEIAKIKYNIVDNYMSKEMKKGIESLFHFNKSSHYSISIKDAYSSALKFKRIIEFQMDEINVMKYIYEKSRKRKNILQEIV